MHTNLVIKLIHLLSNGYQYSRKQLSIALGISDNNIDQCIDIAKKWGVDINQIPYINCYHLYFPLKMLDKNIIYTQLSSNRLTVLDIIDSTNQYFIERIHLLQSGDACITEYQTHGRGKFGRKWISPFGKNICISIYWYFQQSNITTTGLSMIVAISIAEMLKKIGIQGVHIKYPNDICLNNEKCAGILVEIIHTAQKTAHAIIGIGLNLSPFITLTKFNIRYTWIDLQKLNISIDRNILAAQLINTLRDVLNQFEKYGLNLFITRYRTSNFL